MNEIGDRQVGVSTEHQEPQPCRLGGGFHGGKKTVHGRSPGKTSRKEDAIIRI
jgi:hypothetical protein